jgi:hypothetical protein
MHFVLSIDSINQIDLYWTREIPHPDKSGFGMTWHLRYQGETYKRIFTGKKIALINLFHKEWKELYRNKRVMMPD